MTLVGKELTLWNSIVIKLHGVFATLSEIGLSGTCLYRANYHTKLEISCLSKIVW